MQLNRRTLARAAVAAAALGTFATAFAAGWPDKPVKMVVAFTAGGPTDVVARMIGQKLGDKWGQQVIVENKPGAAGLLGSEYVARAPADGYTLLMATAGNLTVNQHLYKNMRFDPVQDFTPIAQTAGVDFVLVTQPESPFKNVKDVIAAAKAKPETVTSSTSGVGGAPFLAAALFENEAGVKLNKIAYKGTADAVNAVLGKQTQLDFDAASQVMPQIKAGKLRPLAVLGAKRSPLLPDVPTMAEAGLANYNFSNWFGLVGPAKLPPEIVAKLQKDVADVLRDPQVVERYRMLGLQGPAVAPAQFGALIQSDSDKWAATIKAAHIAAQ